MKSPKDIEQQLAAASEAWDTQPEPALWDRLESRLDAAQPSAPARKPGKWPFWIVGIALVVGLCGWWYMSGPSSQLPSGKAFAAADAGWAALPVFSGEPIPSITEDNAAKLSFGGVPDGKPSLLGSNPPTFGGLSKGSTLSDLVRGNRILLPPPTGTREGNLSQVGLPSQSQQVQVDPSAFPIASHPYILTNGNGNTIGMVDSLAQYSAMNNPTGNTFLQLNVASNHMNYNLDNPSQAQAQRADLQHFKWLLGSWKTNGNSGGTIEEWRQIDDFTLSGRGYFVVNGDTILTQEMRIEQRGENVYYVLVKDQNNRSMKFRLRSRASNEAIFEDESHRTDQELVLRNKPKTNEAETFLSNSDMRAKNPTNPTPEPGSYRSLKRK